MGDYGRADDRLVVVVLIVVEAAGLAVLCLGTERAAVYRDAVKRFGQYVSPLRGSSTRRRLRLVECFEPGCDWSCVGQRILAEVDAGTSW